MKQNSAKENKIKRRTEFNFFNHVLVSVCHSLISRNEFLQNEISSLNQYQRCSKPELLIFHLKCSCLHYKQGDLLMFYFRLKTSPFFNLFNSSAKFPVDFKRWKSSNTLAHISKINSFSLTCALTTLFIIL